MNPESYSIIIDFMSGSSEYKRENKIDSTDTCTGSLLISEGIDEWQSLAKLAVCRRNQVAPVSDGFVDSITLFYSNPIDLPDGIDFETSNDMTTVVIQEKFLESVAGNQQFDCNGFFAIDTLIKDKVPCLGIE